MEVTSCNRLVIKADSSINGIRVRLKAMEGQSGWITIPAASQTSAQIAEARAQTELISKAQAADIQSGGQFKIIEVKDVVIR